MFKSSVAWVLNKYLGKYVQDLDTENLNVGIFNGEVQLHDLKLKPEALYELKLPIEVREGLIGSVFLSIPWNGFLNQPVVLTIEDVYIVAGAVVGDMFDAELEKRLLRARKKRILDELEEASMFGKDDSNEGLFEKLATNLAQNMQIYIRNVHIRYEDTTSVVGSPLSCGLCLQSLSIETTNNKWKPTANLTNSSSTYQLLRVQSLSFYWNPCTHSNGLVLTSGNWRQSMHQGLQTFAINGEEFEFVLKPVSAKAKLIITKSNEATVPKMLLDVVLQDTVIQISRTQFSSMVALQEAFQRIDRNREYREFHPGVNPHKNAKLWWRYATSAVLEQRVRPYTWSNIKKHRETYREYLGAYTKALLEPNNTEHQIDLQKLEDQLQVVDLVIAREHAKINMSKRDSESVVLVESERWWLGLWKCVEPDMKYKLATEATQGFWSRLSQQEKQRIKELLNKQDQKAAGLFIEHKYNFTLANLSLSLVCHGQEIALASVTQFLVSFENRPAASAFKFSARAENFLLEGLGADNELLPLIQLDNFNSETGSTAVFALDFEKNPAAKEADFAVTLRLQAMEMVYNERMLSELIGFFQTFAPCEISEDKLLEGAAKARDMALHFIEQKKRVHLNIALRGPILVVPEHGSIQKSGNLFVLDTGWLKVSTELQSGPIMVDEETMTELEEHLYDRLNFEWSALQCMFCDCSDEWREKLKAGDSDMHLFTASKVQFIVSNSVKPEYRQLPRQKMNLSLSTVKLNISNKRVGALLDFADAFPIPAPVSIHFEDTPDYLCGPFAYDVVPLPPDSNSLRLLRSTIVRAHLCKEDPMYSSRHGNDLSQALAATDKDPSSSDQSDEEMEMWAKVMDQPGFEDNVSPNNSVKILIRFTLGELVINFSRAENKVDVPYLMLRFEKICVDSALLDYGPAIQFSLGSLQLVDKIHTSAGGCYIELISGQSSSSGQDLLSILYRKVTANCPDFKTHFHSVEHSVVFNLQTLCVYFHREAFASHIQYFQGISTNVAMHDSAIGSMLYSSMSSIRDSMTTMSTLSLSSYLGLEDDPPVPPGATKLSYSVRVGELKFHLFNTDLDFLNFQIVGFETDCMMKANERTVHRMFLNSIHLEDLSDITLHSKIIYLDGDNLLDAKYVLHSPRVSSQSGVESVMENIKSDGTLRARLGRLNIVYLHKFGRDIMHFLDPFINVQAVAIKALPYLAEKLNKVRHFAVKLQLSLDIALPTLLVPQSSNSPNLLILNFGKLTVENFFKWSEHLASQKIAMENILAKLEGIQISRAIMTLTGSMEVQEPILEPTTLNIDLKRRAHLKPAKARGKSLTPLYIASGSMENITINLGQKDIATMLMIYQDNFIEGLFADVYPKPCTKESCGPQTIWRTCIDYAQEETPISELQTFLCHTQEPDFELSFVIDSFRLTLFMDMDEDQSSPVRDLLHALCQFELEEFSTSVMAAELSCYTVKTSLANCVLRDTKECIILEQKSFFDSTDKFIERSKPHPFVECTITKSEKDGWKNNIIVECYVMNISIQFLANLANFLTGATSLEKSLQNGIVNYGYIGDLSGTHRSPRCSGVVRAAQRATTSILLRRSEVNFCSEMDGGPRFSLHSEVQVEQSSEPDGTDSFDVTVSRVQVTLQEEDKPSQVILQSLDLEYSRRAQLPPAGVKVNVCVSPVHVTVSSRSARLMCGMVDEMTSTAQPKEACASRMPPSFQNLENLWTPKKIPVCVPIAEDALSFRTQLTPEQKTNEQLLLSISKIGLTFQVEKQHTQHPLLQIESSVAVEVQDWTSQMQLQGQIRLQASYFNESIRKWESLIEPTSDAGGRLSPWEIAVQLFHAKSFGLVAKANHEDFIPVSCSGPTRTVDHEDGTTLVERQNVELDGAGAETRQKRKRYVPPAAVVDDASGKKDQYLDHLSKLIGCLVCDDNDSDSDDDASKEWDGEPPERPDSLSQVPNDSVATYVLISAKRRLELSLSSAAIESLNTLFNSILGDVELCSLFSKELEIQNCIGPSSTVVLSARLSDEKQPTDFVPIATAHYEKCDSERSSPDMFGAKESYLEAAVSAEVLTPTYKDTPAAWYQRTTSTRVTVNVDNFTTLHILVPPRSASSIHPLHPPKNNVLYHVLLSVENRLGSRIIAVQSPLSVHNKTAHALSLFYQKSALTEIGEPLIGDTVNPFDDLVRVAVIEPSETYSVPLFVAYHSRLHVQPAYIDNCKISEKGLWWRDFRTGLAHLDVTCLDKVDSEQVVFSLTASIAKRKTNQVELEQAPNYVVTLLPPVRIHNCLPLSVELLLPTSGRQLRIESGNAADVHEFGPNSTMNYKIKISSYLGASWTGSLTCSPDTKEGSFQLESEGKEQKLEISSRLISGDGHNIYLYTTHWVVNQCGMPLQLRSSTNTAELEDEQPVLVTLSASQDVQFKVGQSSWSKAISLNAAGTSGVAICVDPDRGNKIYRLHVGTSFTKSCPALTKIVSIAPYFLVVNNCRKHLRFMEDNEKADLWIDLATSKCVPFWPETTSMKIMVKFRDGKVTSQMIPVSYTHKTVLKMDKGCGLTVKVTGGVEAPFTVEFTNFEPGEAPVRIDNLCEFVHIRVQQQSTSQPAIVLSPYQSILYTWNDPCRERVLQWNASNAKSTDVAFRAWHDGFGVERISLQSDSTTATPNAVAPPTPSSISTKISAGLRRFSKPSFDAASKITEASASESNELVVYWVSFLDGGQRVLMLTTDLDTALKTKTMINPENGSFELLLALTGLGVSLAVDPERPTEELAYASAQQSAPSWELLVSRGWCPMPFELAAWCEEKFAAGLKTAALKSLIQIDFDKMQLIKPFFAEVRRVQAPALWFQYRRSMRQVYIHGQLHHLQIDNQLSDAESPTVLGPLPGLKGALQPSFEFTAYYQNFISHTVCKFVKVNFGSFVLDANKKFFTKIADLLQRAFGSDCLEPLARADVSFAHQPIALKQSKKIDYDFLIESLSISPLTIQIRYSHDKDDLNFPVSSWIAGFFEAMEEIQDQHLYTFRLLPTEKCGVMLPSNKVTETVFRHYWNQLLQQFYTSVLSLNVLTNQFNFTTDFGITEEGYKRSDSVGVETLADGIAFGAKVLMGYAKVFAWHCEPSSNISEYLIAFASKEQRDRPAPPASAPAEMLEYENSLNRAILGISGIFYKDFDDDVNVNAEQFLKGTGARFVEMIQAGEISSPIQSLDYAIRRLVDYGELSMATRIRLPKYTNPYMGFKIYSIFEATGCYLLSILRKSLPDLEDEIYWAHAPLNADSTSIAMITNKRVVIMQNTKTWSKWNVEKNMPIADLVSVPDVEGNRLIFKTVKNGEVYRLEAGGEPVVEWLQKKIETAMIASMEEKPCPSVV